MPPETMSTGVMNRASTVHAWRAANWQWFRKVFAHHLEDVELACSPHASVAGSTCDLTNAVGNMRGGRAQRGAWCAVSRPRILCRTMVRNAFFAVLLGLFVACSQSESTGAGSSEEGQTGDVSSSGTSSGTGGSSSTSGGTGGASLAICDDASNCGDFVSECTGCAVAGPCAEVYDGCFGDATCLDFNKCWAGCEGETACREACASANPVGGERYRALLTCIVCQVCPKSCEDSEFASSCP